MASQDPRPCRWCSAGRQSLEAAYRENRLPIGCFAKLFHRPVFDVVRHLASDRSLGVRADDGERSRWETAIAAGRSDELVVDGTVLASALVLGMLDDLARLGPKLVMPQAVLDELRRISLDAGNYRSGRGTMGLHQGQFFFRELSPEEMAAEVERLERVIAFVQAHCEVIGGEATLDMPVELRETLQEMLDATSVDAIALAVRRKCPLWADDLGLQRLLVEINLLLPSVWTQAVLRGAHAAGKLSRTRLDELHAALLDRGYIFTRLTADDILGVLDAVSWRLDSSAGQALLRVLLDSALKNQHNLVVVVLAMKLAWDRTPRDRAKGLLVALMELDPARGKLLARRVYRLGKFRRRMPVATDTMAQVAGAASPRHAVRAVPVVIDPLGDRTGRAVRRFVRAWRSREGEFRPPRRSLRCSPISRPLNV